MCTFSVMSLPVCEQIFTEEDEVVISDALAGHFHQVQVRARDGVNSESQWSEWSQLHLFRPWEGGRENNRKKQIIKKMQWKPIYCRTINKR